MKGEGGKLMEYKKGKGIAIGLRIGLCFEIAIGNYIKNKEK